MRKIRLRTFETNSSSTHTITMCSEDTYTKWQNGDLYYNDYDEKFYTKEARDLYIKQRIIIDRAKYKNDKIENEDGSVKWEGTYTYKGVTVSSVEDLFTDENIAEITDEDIENFVKEDNYYAIPLTMEQYDKYIENYEYYEERYTTKGGEEIVAFGYFGSDY